MIFADLTYIKSRVECSAELCIEVFIFFQVRANMYTCIKHKFRLWLKPYINSLVKISPVHKKKYNEPYLFLRMRAPFILAKKLYEFFGIMQELTTYASRFTT